MKCEFMVGIVRMLKNEGKEEKEKMMSMKVLVFYDGDV